MADKSCVICSGTEADGELLLQGPCGRHWICSDDISSYFENATTNESLFPPKCCGQVLLLQEYEDFVDFDVAWAFQVKEQGEYSVLAKYRVYCANPPCAKFLHPQVHVTDQESKITYAICEDSDCGFLTCCSCKTLLEHGTQNHVCKESEEVVKFKQTATEKGYKECNICGTTVELAEACNHITCDCGHQFCYVCGKEWPGVHGCPRYGPADYDEEGYNKDGYHRDTGLNRDGLTRRQEVARRREEDPELDDDDIDFGDDDDDDDDDNDDEFDDEGFTWRQEVIQTVEPDSREFLAALRDEDFEDALIQLREAMWENGDIPLHDNVLPQQAPQLDPHHESDDSEDEEESNEGWLDEQHIREDDRSSDSDTDNEDTSHSQNDNPENDQGLDIEEPSSSSSPVLDVDEPRVQDFPAHLLVGYNQPQSPNGSEHSDDASPSTETVETRSTTPMFRSDNEEEQEEVDKPKPKPKLNHQPWGSEGGWPENEDEEL